MSRRMRGLLALASIAIVSSSLLAEAAPAGKLSQRIDLDLIDAAPADVFGTFATMLGAELELSVFVTGNISVRLQNVTAGTALAAVCESIGCRSELQEGERFVLRVLPVAPPASPPSGAALRQSLESPMSVSLKDAAAADVLESISRMLQAKLRLQEVPAETVTLELQDVPARQALDAVGALIKMDWDLQEERVEGKVERILRVSPKEPVHPASAAPVADEKD